MGQIFTFCLATLHHGIHIKLLNSIKAKWNTFERKANLPNNQTNTIDQLVNQIYSWTTNCLGSFKLPFVTNGQSPFVDKQICKLENSHFGLTLIIFLEPSKPLQKYKLKLWGASLIDWEPPSIIPLFLEMLKCSK